jgi:hypothetical protein
LGAEKIKYLSRFSILSKFVHNKLIIFLQNMLEKIDKEKIEDLIVNKGKFKKFLKACRRKIVEKKNFHELLFFLADSYKKEREEKKRLEYNKSNPFSENESEKIFKGQKLFAVQGIEKDFIIKIFDVIEKTIKKRKNKKSKKNKNLFRLICKRPNLLKELKEIFNIRGKFKKTHLKEILKILKFRKRL